MKLIVFPLVFLIFASMLSIMGMSEGTFSSTGDFYGTTAQFDGYYDNDGNLKAYVNGTAANEQGYLQLLSPSNIHWVNSTDSYHVTKFNEGDEVGEAAMSFDLSSSLGLIIIVIGLMALAAVAGLRVLGSGVSETSVKTIVLGTGLLALWGVFSVFGLTMITAIPIFGVVIYFFLTAIYTLGVIQQVGGGSEQ